jgi:hypothetical protein
MDARPPPVKDYIALFPLLWVVEFWSKDVKVMHSFSEMGPLGVSGPTAAPFSFPLLGMQTGKRESERSIQLGMTVK